MNLKTHEATSYQNRLEMAINDANAKIQQLRDKYNLKVYFKLSPFHFNLEKIQYLKLNLKKYKERSWVSKYAELEAKVSSLQLNSHNNLRSKDEVIYTP